MSKEVVVSDQPRGVCWAGTANYDLGLVRAEAYFRMTLVSTIRDIFLESGGNLQKTVSFLNRGLLPSEEEFGIKPNEVVEIVDWASRNPIKTVVKL